MKYSEIIKSYRKEKCLTQQQFADIVGVKLNTVCRWETEKNEPSYRVMKTINNLVGTAIKEKSAKLIKSPLNYTGNKYRILPQIMPHLPKRTGTFVDMFCGGATVGINVNADIVYFIDSNERVISLLRFLAKINFRRFVNELEKFINEFGLSYSNLNGYSHYFNIAKPNNNNDGLKMYNKKGFEELRNKYNSILDKDSDEANTLLYLLLVYGFNNDLRFNKKGEYNLPCGKTDLNKFNLKKVYEFNLKAQQSKFIFICGDFRDPQIQKICFDSDFVYLDPPYLITDAVYNEMTGWNNSIENELIDFLSNCRNKHVPFCLSNILSKENNNKVIINKPLYNFIKENDDLKVIDIDYHYRSSSYNKKNRNSKEREIIVLSEGDVYEN
ncbi:MAG: Dam family site-specific DNA-(adenine-N6)-methyltransferase [Candidatus Onthovivens sp.]|nr:Dam family site-specific DNA-(adenine-N6)-methyltransferase [Candidatus Onthovivens sp.]